MEIVVIICILYIIAFVCAYIEIKGREERMRRRIKKNRELFEKIRTIDVNEGMLK